MEPYLKPNDKQMFYKYLQTATHYFEYGSGGSTYQAASSENIQKVYSVESDFEWHNKLKEILHDKTNISFFYNEMDASPNDWGNPGPKSTPVQWEQYSSYYPQLPPEERRKVDFILVDGRFRVACCLKSFAYMSDSCILAFDDFGYRPFYHIVLDFFRIIDVTQDNNMVILQKKPGVDSVPDSLIEYYEHVKD